MNTDAIIMLSVIGPFLYGLTCVFAWMVIEPTSYYRKKTEMEQWSVIVLWPLYLALAFIKMIIIFINSIFKEINSIGKNK